MNLHFMSVGWADQDATVHLPPPELDRGQTMEKDSCIWNWNAQEWGRPPTEWKLRRVSTLARSPSPASVFQNPSNFLGVQIFRLFEVQSLECIKTWRARAPACLKERKRK